MNEIPPGGTQLRDMVHAINQLIRGRGNNVDSVTLTANDTTTTVTPDVRIMNSAAKILLTPTTANAAAEQGNGTMYVSEVTRTTFTITHANNAQADRTFQYAIIGG